MRSDSHTGKIISARRLELAIFLERSLPYRPRLLCSDNEIIVSAITTISWNFVDFFYIENAAPAFRVFSTVYIYI